MTLWSYNKTGEHKNKFMPRAHKPMQALWRSFGLLIPERGNVEAKRPGIMVYYHRIAKFMDNPMVTLHAVSMLPDGNATSWMPIDEISDMLSLNEIILTDDKDNGWSGRVRNIVAETKNIVEGSYKKFLGEIAKRRGIKSDVFAAAYQATLYEKIDHPFREWLWRIQPEDDKAAKESLWKKELYGIALREAEQLMKHLTPRDYKGEENCITAYQVFKRELYKKLLPDGN